VFLNRAYMRAEADEMRREDTFTTSIDDKFATIAE
jgi:hypothetical protein